MNICINALYFEPGHMGGVETYLLGLFRHLPVYLKNDSCLLITGSINKEYFQTSDQIEINYINTFQRPDPRWFLNILLNAAMRADLHSTALSSVKADVVHYPFSLLLPPVSNLPSVLTFHDMQHEFYPAFFALRERFFRARTYKSSAQKATRLIAISNHVKQCLVERYGIANNKIDVVYDGYSPDFRVIKDNQTTLRVRQQYGLDRPFMYYPAATWPHKNHIRLLGALKLLVTRYNFDGQLVLTGVAKDQNDTVLRKIADLGLEKHVKLLGYLPFADLPYLYNMARLLVFPSLFEGFGIPLVEAMACGCPVVAANCTSIPEVLADAGKLFDPTSVENIAEQIWSVWKDDTELIEMREKGLVRAEVFTWENTAKETLHVYQKAVM